MRPRWPSSSTAPPKRSLRNRRTRRASGPAGGPGRSWRWPRCLRRLRPDAGLAGRPDRRRGVDLAAGVSSWVHHDLRMSPEHPAWPKLAAAARPGRRPDRARGRLLAGRGVVRVHGRLPAGQRRGRPPPPGAVPEPAGAAGRGGGLRRPDLPPGPAPVRRGRRPAGRGPLVHHAGGARPRPRAVARHDLRPSHPAGGALAPAVPGPSDGGAGGHRGRDRGRRPVVPAHRPGAGRSRGGGGGVVGPPGRPSPSARWSAAPPRCWWSPTCCCGPATAGSTGPRPPVRPPSASTPSSTTPRPPRPWPGGARGPRADRVARRVRLPRADRRGPARLAVGPILGRWKLVVLPGRGAGQGAARRAGGAGARPTGLERPAPPRRRRRWCSASRRCCWPGRSRSRASTSACASCSRRSPSCSWPRRRWPTSGAASALRGRRPRAHPGGRGGRGRAALAGLDPAPRSRRPTGT